MPLYQPVNKQMSLDQKTIRKIMKETPKKERELLEAQKTRLIGVIRGRGGRFGAASAEELLSKIGMLLVAEEKNLPPKLHHTHVMRKLIDSVD